MGFAMKPCPISETGQTHRKMATQSYRPTANKHLSPGQRNHQIEEVDVSSSTFMRTTNQHSAHGRGTPLSVRQLFAPLLLILVCKLNEFVRFIGFASFGNALLRTTPRVIYLTRREEKLPWAHKITEM